MNMKKETRKYMNQQKNYFIDNDFSDLSTKNIIYPSIDLFFNMYL